MAAPNKNGDLEELGPLFIAGPLKFRLPEDIHSKLSAYVDFQCGNPERVSYADRLVGRTYAGEQLEGILSLDRLVLIYICAMGKKYLLKLAEMNGQELDPNLKVKFMHGWINKFCENDYNPVHCHGGDLSGVIYIKAPNSIQNAHTYDGKLGFFYGEYRWKKGEFLGERLVAPNEGDMYIFPASLKHVVYPFKGEGERISYAFNLTVDGTPPR